MLKKIAMISIVLLITVLIALPGNCEAKKRGKRKTLVKNSQVVGLVDRSGQWGVGLTLGDPSGITVKYWQDYNTAFDFAIGSQLGDAGVGIHADYLIHMRPFEEAPEAPIYIGGGLFIGGSSETFSTGARGVAGISYLFDEPFDIFFELAPKFMVAPNLDFFMSLAIGGRLYF